MLKFKFNTCHNQVQKDSFSNYFHGIIQQAYIVPADVFFLDTTMCEQES